MRKGEQVFHVQDLVGQWIARHLSVGMRQWRLPYNTECHMGLKGHRASQPVQNLGKAAPQRQDTVAGGNQLDELVRKQEVRRVGVPS